LLQLGATGMPAAYLSMHEWSAKQHCPMPSDSAEGGIYLIIRADVFVDFDGIHTRRHITKGAP